MFKLSLLFFSPANNYFLDFKAAKWSFGQIKWETKKVLMVWPYLPQKWWFWWNNFPNILNFKQHGNWHGHQLIMHKKKTMGSILFLWLQPSVQVVRWSVHLWQSLCKQTFWNKELYMHQLSAFTYEGKVVT